jgi:hypothetical protein
MHLQLKVFSADARSALFKMFGHDRVLSWEQVTLNNGRSEAKDTGLPNMLPIRATV